MGNRVPAVAPPVAMSSATPHASATSPRDAHAVLTVALPRDLGPFLREC